MKRKKRTFPDHLGECCRLFDQVYIPEDLEIISLAKTKVQEQEEALKAAKTRHLELLETESVWGRRAQIKSDEILRRARIESDEILRRAQIESGELLRKAQIKSDDIMRVGLSSAQSSPAQKRRIQSSAIHIEQQKQLLLKYQSAVTEAEAAHAKDVEERERMEMEITGLDLATIRARSDPAYIARAKTQLAQSLADLEVRRAARQADAAEQDVNET